MIGKSPSADAALAVEEVDRLEAVEVVVVEELTLEVVELGIEDVGDAEWPLVVRVEADAAGAGAETLGAVGAVTPPRSVGADGAGAGAGVGRRSSRSRISFLTSLP